ALFNFLPLLPLDGGHILISLIEGARGRALPQRVYERMSTLGITLIMFVTVIAFANGIAAPVFSRNSSRYFCRVARAAGGMGNWMSHLAHGGLPGNPGSRPNRDSH